MYFVKASYLVYELTILLLKCQHQTIVKQCFTNMKRLTNAKTCMAKIVLTVCYLNLISSQIFAFRLEFDMTSMPKVTIVTP